MAACEMGGLLCTRYFFYGAVIVTASSGAHVTLPEWCGSTGVGMIVPQTKVRK
jgi:hypothetical protein